MLRRAIMTDSKNRLTSSMPGNPNISRYCDLFAAERLDAMMRSSEAKSVLFMCEQNIDRSQISAAWFNHMVNETYPTMADSLAAHSAAYTPCSELNPLAVQAMLELGVDMNKLECYSKPWTSEVVDNVKMIISVGCKNQLPMNGDTVFTQWEVENLQGKDIDSVRAARDAIVILVNQLLVDLTKTMPEKK